MNNTIGIGVYKTPNASQPTQTQTQTPLVQLRGIFAEHNIRHVHMLVTTIHLVGDFIDQFALYESGALLLDGDFFRSVGDGNHDEGLQCIVYVCKDKVRIMYAREVDEASNPLRL